ncbi:uncharacterized protein N7482_008737 [Penicillium canariense]|uniref:Uncharacterized protein n=1 Tax=Penicillium canariense TaxID=189055 RepID=A0A9W9HUG0_9EURO|nr:uncharacterized protein N7482_008737 [Penicillium canariense]KAJ5157637.1 hypothetical protein N7482_008737 [Penicillium canariense]
MAQDNRYKGVRPSASHRGCSDVHAEYTAYRPALGLRVRRYAARSISCPRDTQLTRSGPGGSGTALSSALAATRFALHASVPVEVTSATTRPSLSDARVDAALHAHLIFEDPHNNLVHSKIYTDMARPWAGGILPRIWEVPWIEVETDKALVYFYNFPQPHLYHYIAVTEKATGRTSYQKQYTGGPLWGKVVVSTGEQGGRAGWSTYRWRLEAFVDAMQGRTPAHWVSAQDSTWMMECVDAVYKAAGLPRRESSNSQE